LVKLWILSDLHHEMSPDVLDDLVMPDGADLLIIAGDYHRANCAVRHARKQFPDIPTAMVLGNNEHYKSGMSVAKGIEQMRTDAGKDRQAHDRITYVLENETVQLELNDERLRLVGATLWTDFGLLHNFAGHSSYAASAMNDFVYIQGNAENGLALRPIETVGWHKESRKYIEQELRKPFHGKSIVVTHHLPSMRSVAPRYKADALTPAFASACDDLLDLGADLWVHGHTHDSADYMAGRTRVICNPRGYSDWSGRGTFPENQGFNPSLVIEI
jgi:predicted phosphodiesterase